MAQHFLLSAKARSLSLGAIMRMSDDEAHARFKLGQDENDGTFAEITQGLDNRELADWMCRTRS